MTIASPPAANGRKRLYNLDAMRGFAAILVTMHHFGLVGVALVPAGFLAVDFFFALSGLVIARSYAAKLADGRISRTSFVLSRLHRLYPVYLAGTLIGFCCITLTIRMSGGPAWSGPSAWSQVASALLMVPSVVPLTADNPLYPANPPAWSLFFEIVANVAFALWLYRARTARLILFVLVSFVVFAISSYVLKDGNMSPIWRHALWGVPRVMFNFTVGMALARALDLTAFRYGWLAAIPSIILAATLLLSPHLRTNLPIIGFLYPLLLVLGAKWESPAPLRSWCEWLGDISYPLYGIHYPLLFLWHALSLRWGLSPILEVGSFLVIALLAATGLARADAMIRQRVPLARWITSRATAPLPPR